MTQDSEPQEPTKALAKTDHQPPAKNGQAEGRQWTPPQQAFIEWLACPVREPPEQQQLADKLKLHPLTLTKWKHLDGLTDAVITRTRELLRADDVPDILHSHAKLGRTNVKSAALVLKSVGLFNEHTDGHGGTAIQINIGTAGTSRQDPFEE